MADNFEVVNSQARTSDQHDSQKVLFRYKGNNVGELEMRNDSEKHYGEVRFNMHKIPVMDLLHDAGLGSSAYLKGDGDPSLQSPTVFLHGESIKNFGCW